MPAFEWVHVQLHQQKGMISLSPPTICNSAQKIQFNRLDFTNFYEDLMNNQKIPDSGVLTQKVKEQIADQLKQAGQ
ncbi:hypothetical protein G3N01_23435|nr:hypothetical protein [Escherichia coli]